MPRLFIALALIGTALLIPRGTANAASTSVPVVLGVSADKITVRTGRHAGQPLKDATTGRALPASNVETYQIKPSTQIIVNGLPAKLQDVKGGMRVSVTTGLDRQVAWRVTASAIPAAQPARQLSERPNASTRTMGPTVDAYWIVAAGGNTITIAERGGTRSMSYRITDKTIVLMNDEPRPAARLRVGMKVIVNVGLDPQTAARIQAHDE